LRQPFSSWYHVAPQIRSFLQLQRQFRPWLHRKWTASIIHFQSEGYISQPPECRKDG
jgi:hypothetical protein